MPEFIKKSNRRAKNKWKKRIYFCHVGRCAGRSIIWNYLQDGWDVIHDDFIRPTRSEIKEMYIPRKHDQEVIPSESFAIVRHPVPRLVSHLRWAVKNKKVKNILEDQFCFLENSIDNLYENELGRQIIPGFDSILFDAVVLQYEMGMRNIADYLVENKMISKWTKNIRISEVAKVKIDWEKCPDSLRDKILKVYEKDFEEFEYDPFEFLKK